jgi:NADH-quinone oxidoreductase subunit N
MFNILFIIYEISHELFNSLCSWFYSGIQFEFILSIIFTIFIFLIRSLKLFNKFQFEYFYYTFFFILVSYYVSNLSNFTYSINNYISPIILLEINIIKVTIVTFWSIFIVYLSKFYNHEYFKKGEEKILCIDLALCGSIFFSNSVDILDIFIGLELIAFPTYALIALDKTNISSEATLKYFINSAYASLLFVVSFVVLYTASGQSSLNTFAFYADTIKIQLSMMLIFTAFFIKIGVGPFFHWVPPVYQATSGPTFIFISTVTKVPFLIPFIHLSKLYFLSPSSWVFFYIGGLIISGILLASRNLLSDNNFRRIIAYTSTINFCIAIMAVTFNLINTKLFISFVLVYLISNFSTYLWHYLANTNKVGIEESNQISNFKKNDKFANVILTVIIIFNSGLPPATLFIFKMLTIGSIAFFSPYEYTFFNIFISASAMFASISSYYAYFKILKSVNYQSDKDVPLPYKDTNELNYQKYNFTIYLSLLSVIVFYFGIFFI